MTDMLTAKDMQTLLQVDRSTIYRMAEQGRLPAIKIGKQWRFPNDQIELWLNKKKPSPPVQPKPEPVSEKLSDLLPLDCVQLIQNTFADTLGVMLFVTDMDGNPITEVSNPCGLFSAISDVPHALQKCIDGWQQLATAYRTRTETDPQPLRAAVRARVGSGRNGAKRYGRCRRHRS